MDRRGSRQSFSYPAATQSDDSGNAPVFTAAGAVALVDSGSPVCGSPELGWFTPPIAESGTLSESIAREGSTMLVVYAQDTVPHYTVTWVKYSGAGDPNAASIWSAPQSVSPLPSLDSNAQLANGFNGIFVARSIAAAKPSRRLSEAQIWRPPAATT